MKLDSLIAGLGVILALATPLTAANVQIPDHHSPVTDVAALNALTTGVSEVTTSPPALLPGFVQTPYLQSLSSTSMAVLWQTREPAYGWVEFGQTPALGAKQDASVHGLRTANVTEHRVVLDRLRPGTNYWYRVAFRPIRKFQPYKVEFGPEQGSEPVAFQTLPGPRQPVTAVIFNDLHDDTTLFQQLGRVLVHHIPLYWEAAAGLTNRPPWQQSWANLLKRADLAISGHTHVRAFFPAQTVGNPYPVVIGGGPKTNTATVMILEAETRRLKLRVLDTNGKEVFPTFEKKR